MGSQPIVVLGLGKTGFSCVAYLLAQGAEVGVCDSRLNPPYADQLQQTYPTVPYVFGAFDAALISSASTLVISPGVDLSHPAITAFQRIGGEIIGDIELFARACTVPVIGITGTNGKSTVTKWVGHMFEVAGRKVRVGGNLGTPALSFLSEPDLDCIVLELSSFQLDLCHSLKPLLATILNVTPDHLDRHGSLQAYTAAKQRIYQGAQTCLYNRQDLATRPDDVSGALSFGCDDPKGELVGLDNDLLILADQVMCARHDLRLKGKFNVANALAAMALAFTAGVPIAAIQHSLRTFTGLKHRCEVVSEHGGVTWINDSKGTNVGAACAAIDSLGPDCGKIIWIGGGQSKGADLSPLKSPLEHYARHALLFGESASQLANIMEGSVPFTVVSDLSEAVSAALSLAQSGDIVLLSPACASFDMFENYQQRGECFISLLKKETS